jgi:hypothetical protein
MGERLWTDAEAFIDQIETAALKDGGPLARRLRDILVRMIREKRGPRAGRHETPPIKTIAAMARRLLALETSRFLIDADKSRSAGPRTADGTSKYGPRMTSGTRSSRSTTTCCLSSWVFANAFMSLERPLETDHVSTRF